MFSKKEISVFDWWRFHAWMVIPFANIVVLVNVLFSTDTNKTLQNYARAILLPFIVVILFIWYKSDFVLL